MNCENRGNRNYPIKIYNRYRDGKTYIDKVIGKIFEDLEDLLAMGFESAIQI